MNKIFIVGKRQTSLTGTTRRNIQGFDYEDKSTGLTISVRDGKTEIRMFGKLIDIAVLNAFVIELTQ